MPSPKLKDLQSWFRWVITDPRGVEPCLNATTTLVFSQVRGPEPKPRLLSFMGSTQAASVEDRLCVYSHAYFVRLLESLRSNFSVLQSHVGVDCFRQLVADYLLEHPSMSTTIEELGREFPLFVKSHPSAQAFPYLYDLAQLEWMVVDVIFSNRSPALSAADFFSLHEDQWASAQFELDSTVRFLYVDFSVELLWNHIADKPSQNKGCLLIFRNDEGVHVERLSFEQQIVLEGLSKGQTLEEACQILSQRVEDHSSSLSIDQWFQYWLPSGVIKKIKVRAS